MITIADHISDIVENSIRANATLIEVIFTESKLKDICTLEITDNGCGMDHETLQQASNPFFTSRETRKIGLGLALLKQNAEQANGSFQLFSQKDKGTRVVVNFQHSNIDRPPLGDIATTIYLLFLTDKNLEIIYTHRLNTHSFSIKKTEIEQLFNPLSLQNKKVREGIISYVNENLKELE